MDAEQVANKEYEVYNPDRFAFRWNADFTEVDIVPLKWWDDSSYAAYQASDPGGEYEDEEGD